MDKSKGGYPPQSPSAPPPYAPPSYSQAVGGVSAQAPFTPQTTFIPAQAGEVPLAPVYGPQRVYFQGATVTPAAYTSYGCAGAPTAVVTTVVPLGSQSTHMICPHCHAEVDTTTKTYPSVVAWLSGFIICIVGCWMGCCLIPCCMNDCMNVEHGCPSCGAFLGKYKRG